MDFESLRRRRKCLKQVQKNVFSHKTFMCINKLWCADYNTILIILVFARDEETN